MASRRDQLHSYQFMIQRVVAALVMRETDPAQSPFRRAAGAVFAGVMVAAIVVAGFAVYGLWDPGGNMRWKVESDAKGGAPVVVIEEETGASYVYMYRKLHPAENFVSAMLVGSVDGRTKQPYYVSRDSLASAAGLTMGSRIGIPGAPDSLPSAKNLIHSDWSLCSQRTETESNDQEIETVMVVGGRPSQGQPAAREAVILVQDETGTKYLIYQSHRFRISSEQDVLQALGIRNRNPLTVGAAWLNGLPEGQEIAPLLISGYGEPATVLAGTTVGTVVRVRSTGSAEYYLVLRDKLASITEFQAVILETVHKVQAREFPSGEVANLEKTDELLPSRQDLKAPPESARLALADPVPDAAICAIFGVNGAADPTLVHSGSLAGFGATGVTTTQRGSEGEQLASRVVVPPGRGALVWSSQDRQDRAPRLCLITDTGRYYTLATPDVLGRLGYDRKKVKPGWMPSNLVARLPQGPTLDPEAALEPVLDTE